MALANGYNVIIKQVTSQGNTPLYPQTRAKDVFLADGTELETAISNIEGTIEDIEENYVLQTQIGAAATTDRKGVAELDSNALVPASQLPAATTGVKGAVKIADTLGATSAADASDVAISQVEGRALKDATDALDAAAAKKAQIGVAASGSDKGIAELDSNGLVPTTQLPGATSAVQGAVKIADALPADPTDDASDVAASEVMLRAAVTQITTDYVPKAWMGTAGTTGTGAHDGVATLGTDGKVPASQLPSFVDDVIEGYFYNGQFYEDAEHTEVITPEESKIYIDLVSNKTYRWGGSAYVVISETLALGTTHETAFYGDYGQIAYRHAMNLNPTTGEVETNHNPHGLTSTDIDTLYGYTPVAPTDLVTTNANGLFRSTDYSAFLNMKEIIISPTASAPTFASGSGLWIEIIDQDS